MNKELKKKYQQDFLRIRNLINEFDPCGLIASGAPDDEYDDLTNHVLSRLYDNVDFEEIKKSMQIKIQNFYGGPDLTEVDQYHEIEFQNNLDVFIEQLKK